jgi:hypothetical protein
VQDKPATVRRGKKGQVAATVNPRSRTSLELGFDCERTAADVPPQLIDRQDPAMMNHTPALSYQGAGGGLVARGVMSHLGLAVGKSAPGALFTQPRASWADRRVLYAVAPL